MEKDSKRKVSLETMHRAKLASGVSDRALKTIVREINYDVKIEAGLRQSLTAANQKFASLFKVTEDQSKNPIVYCSNPSDFFASILENRGTSNGDVILRLSIDEGKGFLKVCTIAQLQIM